MKSVLKNLTLIGMGLMIYSCNEKISPELQSGSSTTIPTATVPDEYYFRVVNTSPVVLNYALHRTGAGNRAADCEVSSTATPLSSTLFTGQAAVPHDSKSYDVSCYLEAEELSLFFNGLSYKVEASKNTCEYIGYSPYSYFDSIPGSSGTNYAGVKCVLPVSTLNFQGNALASSIAVAAGATVDGINPIGCGQMVDTNIALGARVPRPIPTDMQNICAFDYTNSGRSNCDTGEITFNFVNVIDGRVNPTDPMLPVAEAIDEPDHQCGGTVAACVEGAIKQIDPDNSIVTEIYASQLNKDFSTSYELPKLMGSRSNMHDIVNYRRGLASLHLNYSDYSAGNETQWADTNYNKSFDPNLMEKYAANMNPDNTAIISALDPLYLAYAEGQGWTRTPFAAEPFLGVNGGRVNPFYTFYCLDRAYEIKARIRMVVRDWDRVFSNTSSEIELISDVYKSVGSRRQDLPSTEEEIPNDPGNYIYYNDKDDWDVLIPMDRSDPNSVGVYDPGDTFWTPTAGWWHTSIFPKNGSPGN